MLKKNYVIYELRNDKDNFVWHGKYYDKKRFVYTLACTCNREYGILNNLSLDMHEDKLEVIGREKVLEFSFYRYKPVYYIGRIDEDTNIISRVEVRDIIDDVLKKLEKINEKREKLAKRQSWIRGLRHNYRFRYDSVPGVHKISRYGNWYRMPKLQRIRRLAEIEEYKQFVRPSERYKNLPTWDDRARHMDKSWKSSYKIRKQWQKHLSNKIYVVKQDDKRNYGLVV